MELAEQLGRFAGQLTETGIGGVTIEYEGHAAALNTRPLTAAALAGLLAPGAGQRQHGQRARDRPRSATSTSATITHEPRRATTRPGARSRSQTEQAPARRSPAPCSPDQEPRMVEIKGIPVEAGLGRHMLYVRNQDKPGFIGALRPHAGRRRHQHRHLPSRPRPRRAATRSRWSRSTSRCRTTCCGRSRSCRTCCRCDSCRFEEARSGQGRAARLVGKHG